MPSRLIQALLDNLSAAHLVENPLLRRQSAKLSVVLRVTVEPARQHRLAFCCGLSIGWNSFRCRCDRKQFAEVSSVHESSPLGLPQLLDSIRNEVFFSELAYLAMQLDRVAGDRARVLDQDSLAVEVQAFIK